jgi:hypothetical protein
MLLGRILPWPNGTVPAQHVRGPAWPRSASACAACATHGLAQLGPVRACTRRGHERTRRSARGGAAGVLCGGDVTGAREAMRGRAWRGLTGAWTMARRELAV